MPLSWDITNIKLPKEQTWVKNEKGEDVLNGLTEIIIFTTIFVGMSSITEKNYKGFHKRLKEFEVATGMKGLLVEQRNGMEGTEGRERKERMPTLEEVQLHIGLKTNAGDQTTKKWHSNIKRIVTETANENIRKEKENGNSILIGV